MAHRLRKRYFFRFQSKPDPRLTIKLSKMKDAGWGCFAQSAIRKGETLPLFGDFYACTEREQACLITPSAMSCGFGGRWVDTDTLVTCGDDVSQSRNQAKGLDLPARRVYFESDLLIYCALPAK